MVETAPALNLRVQHSPNSWLTTPDSTMLNCLLYSRTGVSLCSFTDRTRSVSGFHFFSYSATGQCWKLYFAMAAATQNAWRKSVIDSANSCIVIIFIYINFCRTQQQLCLNSVKIYFGERPLEPSGVISVNHWGISVYVTYCFWSSNTVSKIRFTGKKIKISNPWGSVDPSTPNDAPACARKTWAALAISLRKWHVCHVIKIASVLWCCR